jgi:hypothetical protein
VRLFVYGTLLHPVMLAQTGGTPIQPGCMRPATLRGSRRLALAETPYPTPRRRRGGVVTGSIVEVGAAVVRRLAAYEGPLYRLRRLVVSPRCAAGAWIAPGGTRHEFRRKAATRPSS